MKTTPEILAPCGSRDALTAALRTGADAVYFGVGDFNARKNADNFGLDMPEGTIGSSILGKLD